MRRLLWRGAPIADDAGTPLTRALAAGGAVVVLLAGGTAMAYPPVPTRPVASSIGSSAGRNGMAYRQIILPDLLVVAPKGLSAAQISRIGKVSGVRNVITADGAAIKMGTHQVNVLGVDPQQFRSWTPLATASDQSLWTALASGRFVASQDAAARLGPRRGRGARPRGAGGALPRWPGGGGGGAGRGDPIVSLRSQQLPVQPGAPGARGGKPASYLQLFQQSAADFCPGLSWTVLAAIGQIESGDGSNVGPSTAGALGPMQFLPSTWAAWGITAFGETGPPNIMDPHDAVPSAARLLCADGAATPAGLAGAIYSYNHASSYVTEVLALARQYAQTYG